MVVVLTLICASKVAESRVENVALHKPATMSSQYAPGYEASNCVDGTNQHLCHTTRELNPWWQVDLGSEYSIGYIVVRNREDCCGERERTLTALISSDGRTWQPVHDNAGKDFQVLSIQVNGRKARYIRLQLRATDYLNLLGVSVFPYEPE